MLRKTIIALFAIASVGLLAPDAASARGGFGGGGFRGGGGFHGGFGGGGFRSAAIGGGGFRSAAVGGGFSRSAIVSGGGLRNGVFAANGFRSGFHHGFRGRGFAIGAIGAGLGYGLYGPYGYYDDYYDQPYYVTDGYYGDGGCTIVQQQVLTPYGWQIRPVQVCN